MNRVLQGAVVVLFIANAAAWEENIQLKNAILILDEYAVADCLKQRNEQLMEEDEYWHYIYLLNQTTSMGSFEAIHTFKYIVGPAVGLGLAWYATINYFIASNVQLFCANQSILKQWSNAWFRYNTYGSFVSAAVVGMMTLTAYGLTNYAQKINRKKHQIRELLFDYRKVEQEPAVVRISRNVSVKGPLVKALFV